MDRSVPESGFADVVGSWYPNIKPAKLENASVDFILLRIKKAVFRCVSAYVDLAKSSSTDSNTFTGLAGHGW